MSESRPTSTEADRQALRALQRDAHELEHIENLLDRFNVFEAIGFVTDVEGATEVLQSVDR